MEIKVIKKHDFISIEVDKLKTDIYRKYDKEVAERLISELIEAADALMDITGQTFNDFVNSR